MSQLASTPWTALSRESLAASSIHYFAWSASSTFKRYDFNMALDSAEPNPGMTYFIGLTLKQTRHLLTEELRRKREPKDFITLLGTDTSGP